MEILNYFFSCPFNMLDDLGGSVQSILSNVLSASITFGLIMSVFVVVFGAILYFSGYSQKAGKGMLMNGVLLVIILTIFYMAMFNVDGPPDISGFFKLPGA
ncbi:MAG: hypothetical protein ACTSVI_01075 [Promethearchaeota archaeon]